jgi:Flp pilus assembly protein TadG
MTVRSSHLAIGTASGMPRPQKVCRPTMVPRFADDRGSSAPSGRSGHGVRASGQALVEFALVVPIFLLLVAAMVDFGLGLNASITVSNAAREGGRLGVITPDSTKIVTRVNNVASSLPGAVTITTSCTKPGGTTCTLDGSKTTGAISGDTLIVTVDFDYPMIWPLAFGTKVHLSSTNRQRVE